MNKRCDEFAAIAYGVLLSAHCASIVPINIYIQTSISCKSHVICVEVSVFGVGELICLPVSYYVDDSMLVSNTLSLSLS